MKFEKHNAQHVLLLNALRSERETQGFNTQSDLRHSIRCASLGRMEDTKLLATIQKMKNDIIIINKMKQTLYSKNANEHEVDVLEDELIQLESDLDTELFRYNEMLQLRDYQDSCNHCFVDDLIDLTPDDSKLIKYCTHCMFTLT